LKYYTCKLKITFVHVSYLFLCIIKMTKISNQRANYSQTRRNLDPDLNFGVGLASLLAGAQASVTKNPKLTPQVRTRVGNFALRHI